MALIIDHHERNTSAAKRLSLIGLCICLTCSACSPGTPGRKNQPAPAHQNISPGTPAPSSASADTGGNGAQASKENEPSPGAVSAAIAPAEAKRLAELHIALRKRSWGVAKEITEVDGTYYVSFDTPDQEFRLLGPRIVLVDKQSGAASVQIRR